MITKLKRTIEKPEQEAKGLLLQLLLRIAMMKHTAYTEEQAIQDFQKTYQAFIEMKQCNKEHGVAIEKVHIVLRMA